MTDSAQRSSGAVTSVSSAEAAALLLRRFGFAGAVAPLASERDQVFAVTPENGVRYILRISVPNELVSTILCQNGALDAIAAADPALPVPRLLPSLSGEFVEWMDHGGSRRAVRLFTYLDGVPVGKAGRAPGQLMALGTCLARLDDALSHFAYGSAGAADVWDVENAHHLAPILATQPDPAIRQAALRAIAWFAENGSELLRDLPRQFIHNDFGPKNVLVDRDNPTRVKAIIDFGDMLYAPRVLDLSVALAKLVALPDPLAEACEMAAAYASRLRLSRREVAALYRLVGTRLAMRIAVWSRRQSETSAPEAAAIIAGAAALLQTFEEVGEERACQALLEACLAAPASRAS